MTSRGDPLLRKGNSPCLTREQRISTRNWATASKSRSSSNAGRRSSAPVLRRTNLSQRQSESPLKEPPTRHYSTFNDLRFGQRLRARRITPAAAGLHVLSPARPIRPDRNTGFDDRVLRNNHRRGYGRRNNKIQLFERQRTRPRSCVVDRVGNDVADSDDRNGAALAAARQIHSFDARK